MTTSPPGGVTGRQPDFTADSASGPTGARQPPLTTCPPPGISDAPANRPLHSFAPSVLGAGPPLPARSPPLRPRSEPPPPSDCPPVPSAATQPAFSTTVPRGYRPSTSASSSGPTRPLADRRNDAVIPDSGSAAPRLGGGSAVLPHLLQKAPSQWPLRHRVTAAFLPLACGFCLFLQFILRTGFPSSRCESVCVPLSSVSGRPSWSC